MTPVDAEWANANRRYLMARLACVCDALGEPGVAPDEAAQRNVADELRAAEAAMPAAAALDVLSASLALSPFERDVVLLCAGVELSSSFAALCAARSPLKRARPTFSLALSSLPDAHWSALTPVAPLRHWHLIELGDGDTLTTSPLRIDERILHFLTGTSYVDERLQTVIAPVPAPAGLPPSHALLAERMAGLWSGAVFPAIHLGGNDLGAKRSIAAAAAAALGIGLDVLRAADVPAGSAERDMLARIWSREAALHERALLIDGDDADTLRPALSFVEHIDARVAIASRGPVSVRRVPLVHLEVLKPTASEQAALWSEWLDGAGSDVDEQAKMLVAQFELGADEIAAAGAHARHAAPDTARAATAWEACRNGARGHLEDLAQRIDPVADWSTLVLPPAQTHALRQIVAQVRHRARVYGDWGLAAAGRRGLGVSALFTGPSGTGKTMAAEVIAGDLRLDLYRIDLSQVVSKYIGETEKNLRRVFDAAEAGGAVLLFDEADALFGKRSDVRDSHDRYANIEVSYLLQRMETYRGLAILTTNMKQALDEAFLRRIRFVVAFPFPDSVQRAEIWRRMYPPETPVEALAWGTLARLAVAGGNIRNIAIHAAFLAADADEAVGMRHLLRAAHTEYAKLEKALTDVELGSWS